jgi:hypothetical protein
VHGGDRRWRHCRRRRRAAGRGNDVGEELGDAERLARRDERGFGGIELEIVGELLEDAVDVGVGRVDLVERGNDSEVGATRECVVGESLSLNALRGVDEQHGALAAVESTRDLVGEVDVARRVDQIDEIGDGVFAHQHRYNVRFDCNATLAFNRQPSSDSLSVPGGTVRVRASRAPLRCCFAMINVSNN